MEPTAYKPAQERESNQHHEDLSNLTPVMQFDAGLNVAGRDSHFLLVGSMLSLDGTSQLRGESTGFKVLVHELIFLGPSSSQPGVKFLLIIEGNA